MSEKIQTLVGIPPKERARLLDVEQKAIALLRALYLSPNYYDDETLETAFEELREAIGVSCVDLRGAE